MLLLSDGGQNYGGRKAVSARENPTTIRMWLEDIPAHGQKGRGPNTKQQPVIRRYMRKLKR